jgi:hypothetical protein
MSALDNAQAVDRSHTRQHQPSGLLAMSILALELEKSLDET